MRLKSTKWVYGIMICIIFLHCSIANGATDYHTEGAMAGKNDAHGGGSQGPNYLILGGVILIVVLIVSFSYLLISRSMKRQLEKNLQLISKIIQTENGMHNRRENQDITAYKRVLLKFLNYNENRVMKILLENDGSVLQSEISRLPNMGKVKAHRVLRDMKVKGIITIDQYGKTNRVNLSEDIRKIFLNQ